MSRVKKCKLRPLTAKIEKKYLSYEFDIHDIEVNELRESLLKALEVLSTAREIKIIKMLYGIGVDRSYTLEEIGRKFDVRAWVKLYEGTTRPYVRMSEQSLNAERRTSGGRRERE